MITISKYNMEKHVSVWYKNIKIPKFRKDRQTVKWDLVLNWKFKLSKCGYIRNIYNLHVHIMSKKNF